MKKAQVLLLALAVLLLCTACAGVGVAPAPTPTSTKAPTAVPLPTPVGTPDSVWNDLQAGLRRNVVVCLVNTHRFEARVPTGQLTVVNLHWVNTADGIRIHTVRVIEETLTKEGLAEFKTFLFDSEVALDEFARVVVHIGIGNQEFEFWFPVETCPLQTPAQQISL